MSSLVPTYKEEIQLTSKKSILSAAFAGSAGMILLLQQAVMAAEPTESIIVTGSRISSEHHLSAYYKLSRDDIDSMNPLSVTELLSTVPGLSIFQNSQNSRLSYVQIRGGESNFTLIMLDGV